LFSKRAIGFHKQPVACNQSICSDFFYVRDSHDLAIPKYILILKCRFSRFVRLFTCESACSQAVVDALVSWSSDFGLPYELMSDQGSHFMGEVVTGVRKQLGIGASYTPVYAPAANGAAERVCLRVREVLSALALQFNVSYDDWPSLVPLVQLVINQTASRVLAGYTPLQVFTGLQQRRVLDLAYLANPRRSAAAGVDHNVSDAVLQKYKVMDLPPAVRTPLVEMAESVRRMHENVEKTTSASEAARLRAQSEKADIHIAPGDLVFYSLRAAGGVKNAVAPIWFGPALIRRTINKYTYELEDVGNKKRFELHAKYIKEFVQASLMPPSLHEGWLRMATNGGTGSLVHRVVGHEFAFGRGTVTAAAIKLKVQWDDASGEITSEPFRTFALEVPAIVRSYIARVANERDKKKLMTALTEVQSA
jgi:hypothetical protein